MIARRSTRIALMDGAGGGGAPAWSPLSLTNARWVNANALAGAEGSEVLAWNDLSVFADMNFSEPAAGHNGLLRLAKYNGKKAIEFNGVSGDSGMTGTKNIGAQPFTAIAIYAPKTAVSGNYRVLNGQATNWLMGPSEGCIRTYDGDGLNNPAPLDTSKLVVHITTQLPTGTNAASLIVNGNWIASNNGNNAPGIIHIGDRGMFAEAANTFLTDIIEMPCAIITPAEITALMDWANAFYAGSI